MQEQKQDIMRVLITAPDRNILEKVLRDHPVDTGCTGGVSTDGAGVRIEAHVRQDAIERLQRSKVKVEVLGNASAEGRERQDEVGRGNRFKGEARLPRGLGRKVKEERS
ncbi:MAG: hypothetical protein ACXWU6_02290 [Allosphingosinicella sp.]